MKNYLVYPCEIMRITQNYNGKTSHYPHTVGYPKDYPIDEGCSDSGRSWLLCPCDKMQVKRIYGVGSRGVNTIWLQSTSKVYFADGTSDYVTMLITHPEDDDLRKLKVGQTFVRGQKICREGKDGATGNHFHISAGKGKFSGNGWKQNSRGKYVLTTTGGTFKPEKLFYIDRNLTKVISSGGLVFKSLPSTTAETSATAAVKKYTPGNYRVTADLLNVRTGAGTNYPALKFKQLSKDAQAKILKYNQNKKANGYVKGMTFTVSRVIREWGETPSGWVCLKYCVKI